MANEIPLDILVRLDKSINDIQKFREKTESSLESIQKSANAISFVQIGRAAIDAGKTIVNAIGGSLSTVVDEASQAEEAINGLNVSLKLSGSFSESASKQMLDFASNLQATTKFSDEAALGSLTLAKNLGATNEQAIKITKAAADLSAVTGKDLDTNTQALTKSLQGQGGQIQKMLPFLKGLTEEQLRSGRALDEVIKKFKGAAEVLGNTFSGAIAKSKNAFSDFLENLGNIIIKNPIIISLINTFASVMRTLGETISKNSGSIKTFVDTAIVGMISGLGTFLNVLATVLRTLGLFVTSIIGLFRLIVNGLNVIFNIPLTIGEGLATILVKPLLLALATVLDIVALIAKIPGVSGAFKAVGLDVDKFKDGIESAKKGLFQLTKDVDLGVIRKGLVAGVNVLADEMPKAVKTTSDSIDGLGNKLNDFADKQKKNIGKFAKEASDAISNAIEIKPKIDDEAFKNALQTGFKDIIAGFGIKLNVKRLDLSANEAQFLGAGAAVIDALLKGADGAKKLISTKIVAPIFEALAPEFGSVAAGLFEVLSQSPEKINEMVTQFIQSIPIILENVLLSIPTIIEAIIVEVPRMIDKFIEEIPRVIQSIIDKLPMIVISLATMMPMVATKLALEMPRIAVEWTTQLVKNIPLIVKGFVNEIGKQMRNLGGLLGTSGEGGGIGGFVGGAVKSIGKIFKFADGGIVPSGFPNDSAPALLTSGEIVLNKDGVDNMISAFNSLANRRPTESNGSQNISINLQVGEKQLADVLLQLNRNGFRTV